MIAQWFNFFVSSVGDVIAFLNSFKVIGDISVLQVMVVAIISTTITVALYPAFTR